jgi:hypothetical protein
MGAFASDNGQRAVGKRLNFTQLNVLIELSDCVRDAISASQLRKNICPTWKIQDLAKHALASPVQEQMLKLKKDSEASPSTTTHSRRSSDCIRRLV